MLRHAPLLLLALLGTPSAAGPRLAVAPSILSEEWRQPLPPGSGSGASSWAAFGAPELVDLIARARTHNADIAIARARIAQARGELRVARAAALPTLTAAAGGQAGRALNRSTGNRSSDLSSGAELAWEVDLWGGQAAGKRAARARLAAATFDRDAAALLVEREVVRAFVEHSALADRIALVERSLDNARELERIILIRVREGVATRVDSGLQTVEVRRIEARRSELVEAQGHVRNALAVLVGEEAPRFALAGVSLDSLAMPAIAPVQPADLLVRRPDVRAAEARIAASEGDVGQARAALLPGMTLSARSMLESAGGGPFQLLGAIGADLLGPIFDGGRRKGRLAVARGVQQESVELYRRSLLVALQETEDALTASVEAERRQLLLAATIEEARTTARLARRQYVEGAADLQTLLDSERSLLEVEQDHALALRDRLDALVQLIGAMGGWPA